MGTGPEGEEEDPPVLPQTWAPILHGMLRACWRTQCLAVSPAGARHLHHGAPALKNRGFGQVRRRTKLEKEQRERAAKQAYREELRKDPDYDDPEHPGQKLPQPPRSRLRRPNQQPGKRLERFQLKDIDPATRQTDEGKVKVELPRLSPADQEFLEWVKDHGGKYRCVMPVRRGGQDHRRGRRGLLATTNIDAGKTVAYVPVELVFGTRYLDWPTETRGATFRQQLPWGKTKRREWRVHVEVMKGARKIDDRDMNKLCVALILVHERHVAGEQSLWKPWLDLLPTLVPNFATLAPAHRLHLEGTSVGREVKRLTALMAECLKVVLLLNTHHPETFPPSVFTPEAMIWAFSVLSSREFLAGMAPLFDMVNHPDLPAAETQVGGPNVKPILYTRKDAKEREIRKTGTQDPAQMPTEKDEEELLGLQLVTTRKIAPGEELFMSYGPLPNADLFAQYGFLLRNNPHDSYRLTVKATLPSLDSLKMFWQLGHDPVTMDTWTPTLSDQIGRVEWTFTIPTTDGVALPTGLLPVMRVLEIAEERKGRALKEEDKEDDGRPGRALQPEREMKAYARARKALYKARWAHPTSIAHDAKMLNDAKADSTLKNIVYLRLQEKVVLHQLMSLLTQQQRAFALSRGLHFEEPNDPGPQSVLGKHARVQPEVQALVDRAVEKTLQEKFCFRQLHKAPPESEADRKARIDKLSSQKRQTEAARKKIKDGENVVEEGQEEELGEDTEAERRKRVLAIARARAAGLNIRKR
eukprot:g39548.t1